MLSITEVVPSETSLDKLVEFQKEVDALDPTKENWKELLDTIWASHSASDDFKEIKLCLEGMCPGVARCCYCEDSDVATIEHIEPKALYPQKTFKWENYLYICGKCNSGKNATWAIFIQNGAKRQFYKVPGKRKGQPRTFPPTGDAVLINPRSDNPTTFLKLVLDPKDDKMDFLPNSESDADEENDRAMFTVKTLKLNSDLRPNLAKNRMLAYHDYSNRIIAYDRRKNIDHWNEDKLNEMIVRFKQQGHPTVWFEIKRCYQNGSLATIDPDFHQLLSNVQEALNW